MLQPGMVALQQLSAALGHGGLNSSGDWHVHQLPDAQRATGRHLQLSSGSLLLPPILCCTIPTCYCASAVRLHRSWCDYHLHQSGGLHIMTHGSGKLSSHFAYIVGMSHARGANMYLQSSCLCGGRARGRGSACAFSAEPPEQRGHAAAPAVQAPGAQRTWGTGRGKTQPACTLSELRAALCTTAQYCWTYLTPQVSATPSQSRLTDC